MKLPELEKPEKYQGLYVIYFGDQAGVGFTAQEVAELLESEKHQHIKVYKIHKALPDGKLELKGIPNQTFQLESGMFFYSDEIDAARDDFQNLSNLADKAAPPSRAKLHLAKFSDDNFAVALIYPAEYEDEISSWLIEGNYKTTGLAEGGVGTVQQYYDKKPEVIERRQLFYETKWPSRTGQELISQLKSAVQR